MPVILIVAVLAVLYFSSRSSSTTALGYGNQNQAPPPAFSVAMPPATAIHTGFVDRSGGRLGIDANTGQPFAADSTFGRIATGQAPLVVRPVSAGRTFSFNAPGAPIVKPLVPSLSFTQPGTAPPPPPPPPPGSGGAPPLSPFSGAGHF